jgi:hypothetical protein
MVFPMPNSTAAIPVLQDPPGSRLSLNRLGRGTFLHYTAAHHVLAGPFCLCSGTYLLLAKR